MDILMPKTNSLRLQRLQLAEGKRAKEEFVSSRACCLVEIMGLNYF